MIDISRKLVKLGKHYDKCLKDAKAKAYPAKYKQYMRM